MCNIIVKKKDGSAYQCYGLVCVFQNFTAHVIKSSVGENREWMALLTLRSLIIYKLYTVPLITKTIHDFKKLNIVHAFYFINVFC